MNTGLNGRWRRVAFAAVGITLALALAGCARDFSFANRTDGPVVVSVAVGDADGDLAQVSGAVVDPGTQLDVSINDHGPATVSVWKGFLQQGPAAVTMDLDSGGGSWDLQPSDRGGGIAAVPRR